jgi:hypothetical protein
VSTNEKLILKPACLVDNNVILPPVAQHALMVHGEALISIPLHCSASIGSYAIPLRVHVTTGAESKLGAILVVNDTLRQVQMLQHEHLKEQLIQRTFIDAYQALRKLHPQTRIPPDHQTVYDTINRMTTTSQEENLKPIWIHYYVSIVGWCIFVVFVFTCVGLGIAHRRRFGTWGHDWSTSIPDRFSTRAGPIGLDHFEMPEIPLPTPVISK